MNCGNGERAISRVGQKEGASFKSTKLGVLRVGGVEFALNAGVDPGKHDSQLVEDLLSPHGYSQSSLTAYRRHLREWFETDHDSAS